MEFHPTPAPQIRKAVSNICFLLFNNMNKGLCVHEVVRQFQNEIHFKYDPVTTRLRLVFSSVKLFYPSLIQLNPFKRTSAWPITRFLPTGELLSLVSIWGAAFWKIKHLDLKVHLNLKTLLLASKGGFLLSSLKRLPEAHGRNKLEGS